MIVVNLSDEFRALFWCYIWVCEFDDN